MSDSESIPPAMQGKLIDGPDPINNLNNDCLGRIFQFLPHVDKFRITEELGDLAWENTKCLKFADVHPFYSPDWEPTDLQQLPPRARTKEGIERVLEKCGRHIERLHFLTLMNPEILPIIDRHCKSLVILQIYCKVEYWGKLDCSCLLRLERLYMWGPLWRNREIPGEFFQRLPQDTLIELDLSIETEFPGSTVLPPAALPALRDFKRLANLELRKAILNSDLMNVIAGKSTLKSLNLSACSLKGQLPSFTLLTNLEDLELGFITQVNCGTLIEISRNLAQLKFLSFHSNSVTDRGVSSLRSLTKLVELDITWSPGITDVPLSTMHHLEKLSLFYCRGIRDDGIITLIKYASNLKYLELRRTGITQKVLNEANEIIKQRTNNVKLELEMDQDLIDDWVVANKSPLLYVHN